MERPLKPERGINARSWPGPVPQQPGGTRASFWATASVVALALVCLASPANAGASGETPSASFSLTPKTGTFSNTAFKSANWRVETGVSAPNPPNTELLPTRSITLRLPPAGQMTFNPGDIPVCPDSEIGPDTNNTVPIDTIVPRCPDSIIGNGSGSFLLSRINNPNISPPRLNLQVIVFNGGLDDGQPRLKFWAYSYDLNLGIYTESTITPQGVMAIPVPRLTVDSAVNSLNLNIPGVTQNIFLPNLDKTITLPGGQYPDYVQARCDTGTFPFSADLLLGRRNDSGLPFGEERFFEGVGETIQCSGFPQLPLTVSRSGTGDGSVVSEPAGIDCGSSCEAEFGQGTTVTLAATPSDGSNFAGWSGACSDQPPQCVVTMSESRSVTAEFTVVPPNFRLTATKSGTGMGRVTSVPTGIDCGNGCEADFAQDTAVTLSADPSAGSRFDGWAGACTNQAGDCLVTMSQARSVVATFTATAPSLAALSVSGPGKVRKGKTAKFRLDFENVGNASARGLRVAARGKGVRGSARVGALAAGEVGALRLPLRFSSTGRVKITFTLSSENAGTRTARRSVIVTR